jgi:hypothetical protein
MRLAVVQPRAACGCTHLAKHVTWLEQPPAARSPQPACDRPAVSHSHIFVLRNRTCPVCAVVVAVTSDMFHDLNIPWTDATRELQRTVVFLDECECNARGS